MNIIAHRGYWKTAREKNSCWAFQRAVTMGYGVETDVRDYKGNLVIAHDIPSGKAVSVDKAFKIFSKMSKNQILAVNIKSDGLQSDVKKYLRKFGIKNYFIFDAAIPDLLLYRKNKIAHYIRLSEYEPFSDLIYKADGIWLDALADDWYGADLLLKILKMGKNVGVVSPELHGRSYQRVWALLRDNRVSRYSQQIFLCTDHPVEAEGYFQEF